MKLSYCKKQTLKQLYFKKKYTNKFIENFGQYVYKLHFRKLLRIEGRYIFRPQSNI